MADENKRCFLGESFERGSFENSIDIIRDGASFYMKKVLDLMEDTPMIDMPLLVHVMKSIVLVEENKLEQDPVAKEVYRTLQQGVHLVAINMPNFGAPPKED